MRNSLTSILPVTGWISGLVTSSGSAYTVSSLTGSNAIDRSQVSVTDGGTGLPSIVVTNFKGPQGVCLSSGNAIKSGVILASSLGTYSGNTVTVTFSTTSGDLYTLADETFLFTLTAF